MNVPAAPIRVAIVEDMAAVRDLLTCLIRGSPGCAVVSACASGEAALRELPPLRPGVVLMDIQLPGMSGIDCTRKLKALSPEMQIMMLTVFEDPERIFQALAAGASGYLVKTTPPARVLEAIRELHQGGAPMSGPVARRVIQVFQQPLPAPPSREAPGEHLADVLSPRELEVLQLLAQGLIYKEVANHLGLSINTVRTHITRIYKRLHVRTRTEALLKLIR